ncbi:MAG: haloacid dehalogenase type II [Burkholderiales bacterium]|nr:haloacid dehalogenase type II [Burkholderiales bacterium]MDE2290366.1 haloacid dehalogenase type II [Burkholderiales bacterium]MDE2609907.1 haloacid dehalogenase type II [Burkholderiales bacterium]
MDALNESAIVFDAYGTLFDVYSVAALAEKVYPGRGEQLSQIWRAKQLEYCFLRTAGNRYENFWSVTRSALRYAAQRLSLSLTSEVCEQLMDAYLHLAPFPENLAVLRSLKDLGVKLAILSNGTRSMLEAAVHSAGMEGLFSHVLSVDPIRKFKPDPQVYQLACDALGSPASRIIFVSSNGWDVSGAGWFGFRTFWVNRRRDPIEQLSNTPWQIGDTLTDLLRNLHQVDSPQ